MGTQTGSLDGASGSSSIGGAKVKVVVVAPPGLRPEAITLKVIDPIEGVTALARPGPELLVLLAELKRAGCSEAQIKEALAEQSMRALSQPRPSETEATGYLARPEFAQLLLQLDATRDADGVPTDPELVSAFILRYSETLLDHPFSPLLVVAMNAIVDALAKPDMPADALARLSDLTRACYEALRKAQTRSAANRARRQRKRYRH